MTMLKNAEQAQLIGTSVQMTELREEIERIARTDAKVLITGESGVGKELVARAIHVHSQRADKPFIAMNCAGLPETLLESELFGHVKGSFTGAYRDKPGKLESAHEGTIFLDEVGEMTLRMQGLLLRFLETGELQKVGADRGGRIVNVRLVAATNRNLQDLIAREQFREDLYYRLNVIHFQVPPLRERKEDIPQMIEHFLRRYVSWGGHAVRGFEPEAFHLMVDYAWPGNVRELENVIERAVVLTPGRVLSPAMIPEHVRRAPRAIMPSVVLPPEGISLHWSRYVDLGRLSIGQGGLEATPMQMAQVAAAVANGGELMKPHITGRVVDRDGRTLNRVEAERESTVMSRETAASVGAMMVEVVEHGTGTKAQIPGVKVAGKTGTAETGKSDTINDVWFIGFAPADNPRVAVAVTIKGVVGFGGDFAAPIAKQIMQELLGQ